MIGSDDVLACFIAGNAFTWDDWFRLETMDDSLQPTIDMLLNVAVFMWFGAVCPWHKFLANDVIPIYRLIPLGILVLLLRRLPMVLAFHTKIHQIEEIRHALFVGFFGPIGVSAIFYLYVSREFLRDIELNGTERPDAARLAEIMDVVIWFLVVCSIFVHGLSIPLGKLGIYLPRTISTAISSERPSASQSMARPDPDEPESFHVRERIEEDERLFVRLIRGLRTGERSSAASKVSAAAWLPRSVLNVGQHILNDIRRPSQTHDGPEDEAGKGKAADESDSSGSANDHGGAHPEISRPKDARLIGHAINNPPVDVSAAQDEARSTEEGDGPRVKALSLPSSPVASRMHSPARERKSEAPASRVTQGWTRSIRFPDEPVRNPKAESSASGNPKMGGEGASKRP